MDTAALILSLQLAIVTTVILLLIGLPLAWWLSQHRGRYKPILEAVIALPLVLPPTVIGFYLLVLLGAQGPFSHFDLVFNFKGLVIGSVIYSLPFAVQPLQNAFQSLDPKQLDVALTLRASALDRFISIALPQARLGILTASVLSFAHTLGEFGIVLMIGGNISGQTRTLSIAIYDHVEQLQYTEANLLSAGLLIFSFIVLLTIYVIAYKKAEARLN